MFTPWGLLIYCSIEVNELSWLAGMFNQELSLEGMQAIGTVG